MNPLNKEIEINSKEEKRTKEEIINLLKENGIIEIEGDEDGIYLRADTDNEEFAGEGFINAFKLGMSSINNNIKEQSDKKVSILIDKDIFEHPHFNTELLKLVSKYENQRNLICNKCNHPKIFHYFYRGQSYCKICYDSNIGYCKEVNKGKEFNSEVTPNDN